MLGCVMELELLDETSCRRSIKGLVKCCRCVGIQVVQNNTDHLCIREVGINQVFHALGEVQRCPPVGHSHVTPAALRLGEHEQVTGPFSPILIVMALGLSGANGDGQPNFADHLVRAFVEAHTRALRIVGLRIEIKHILHVPDEVWADRWDAPLFPQPGLQCVFFSVRRTVSSEMESTTLI